MHVHWHWQVDVLCACVYCHEDQGKNQKGHGIVVLLRVLYFFCGRREALLPRDGPGLVGVMDLLRCKGFFFHF